MTEQPAQDTSLRSIIFSFILIAVAIIGGAVLLLVSRPQPVQIIIQPPQPTATAQPTATPGPITVYLTGAITNPQRTVDLPAGSRVGDAITASGDLLPNADLNYVNLAGVLYDGDHVHVPTVGEMANAPTPSGSGLVNVNSATAEALDALPGIGPALAERIIIHREANGPFATLDDLGSVSGIGPTLLEELNGLIRFD